MMKGRKPFLLQMHIRNWEENQAAAGRREEQEVNM